MSNFINIFTDGGAKGNPGPAAIGVVVADSNNREIVGFGKKIGFSTNNIAEYRAVLEALDWAAENKKDLNFEKIFFFLDSLLVYSQIRGLYKVKNSKLKSLLNSLREKEAKIRIPIVYKHIPREKNQKADMCVKKALSSK